MKTYLLGRETPRPGWFNEICYCPGEVGLEFTHQGGYSRDSYGERCGAMDSLSRYEDEFAKLAPWFLPLLRQLAEGERVHINTVRAACRKATGCELRTAR